MIDDLINHLVPILLIKMNKTQTIPCPNCGDRAIRQITDNDIWRTSCHSCDYLLVQCAKTGKVIEAYAPGINSYCMVH
ncbi:hypothetical protein NIES4102_29610 [Chondrocystis sp. NIES-4102]|nr:hypothetical protein NIES4102_29610 [Chondrocystis sp. NIES-4102]